LMGSLVNKPFTNVMGIIITGIIIALNSVLLYYTFTGSI